MSGCLECDKGWTGRGRRAPVGKQWQWSGTAASVWPVRLDTTTGAAASSLCSDDQEPVPSLLTSSRTRQQSLLSRFSSSTIQFEYKLHYKLRTSNRVFLSASSCRAKTLDQEVSLYMKSCHFLSSNLHIAAAGACGGQ